MCNICNKFQKKIITLRSKLDFQKKYLNRFKYALVGMSGGKDSTATAYTAKKMGLQVEGFTFDTGYYPEHIFNRAREYSYKIGIAHNTIDIREYITDPIRRMYKATADWYNEKPWMNPLDLYFLNREHYSAKDEYVMPFIRTCQICRKVVIRAYYNTAIKYGVRLIILGMNEWTHLSYNFSAISAIRKIRPPGKKQTVYITHLPFLLQWDMEDTQNILKELPWWTNPTGENFVESNANSCLFAQAAEKPAYKMLGFHPDTTRLSREISCGYLDKEIARKVLDKIHDTDYSVEKILKRADII